MKKKTTRSRRPDRDRKLMTQVNSPRIFYFNFLRTCGGILKISLVIALFGGLFFGARLTFHHLFVDNEEFALREVPLLKLGTKDLPRFMNHKRIVNTTGIDLSASIFAVDISKMEETLRELPEISAARVTRRLPGTLKIEVEERVPVAWIECESLNLEGRNFRTGLLVDENGIVFPCATSALWSFAERLPVIALSQTPKSGKIATGEILNDRSFSYALDLVKKSRGMLTGVFSPDRVEIRDEITLEMVTMTGSQGIFSYFDQERQLRDFARLLQYAQETKRALGTANLIPTRNIPVTFAGSR